MAARGTARLVRRGLGLTAALAALLLWASGSRAADHGDAPIAGADRSTDIADVYAFLDPNDNSRVVILFNVGGFIVPGEAANFGFFDPALRFRLELETTGDARPDASIEYRFEPRTGGANTPQRVTVELPNGRRFQAMTTASTTNDTPNPQVITEDRKSGALFFAGLVDDPFFFDIPAFGAFVNSVRAGTPNPALLQRGRDSFAGYNCLSMALSLPISHFKLRPTKGNPNGTVIGVQGIVERRALTVVTDKGIQRVGEFRQVERMGNPGTNVVFIPFDRKDEHNFATPRDDAAGQFAGDIVAFLQSLGTDTTSIDILANLVLRRGDYVRVDTAIANSGPGGGNNPDAAFPNGRRLGDDVIDTTLFLVANRTPLSDNVNGNDVPLQNTFPFVAPQQTSRPNGTVDDNTRN
jgi:hypothetical protein